MKASGSRLLPAFASLVCGCLWALFIYLIFILPKQVAGWEDTGEALPAAMVFLIKLGTIGQRFAILVVPFLLLLTIGCIAWYFVASRARSRS